MIAFNHALTGAIIGTVIKQPQLAIPAALASHFICDAIPHYKSHDTNDGHLASKQFAVQLVVDALLCIALVILLATVMPGNWLLPAFCAFIATAPDFAWLPGYLRVKHGKSFALPQPNWLVRFAARIQWFERPIGIWVELVWAAGAIMLLVAYL